jgi:iron complex outermembrane receptor protein/hemoglobin/transferrin/lactoferrin receptor protein
LANYAETFRAPLVTEYAAEGPQNPHYWYIPNADLEPEKAKEYEIGFSVDKDGLLNDADSLRFKAMYFEGDIEDMISFEALGRDPIPGYGPLSPDYNNHQQFGQYQNIEAAKRRGLELGADYWVNDWHLEMSFEHLDIYNKKTREKTPQGFADKLHLAAAYTYQPWDLTLGAEVNHWFKPDQNPDSYVSRGTTYYRVRDDYTLANIKGTWKPKTGKYAGVELVAGVNNVFDKQYINARYSETTSMVGNERNYFVQFKKTF